MKILFLSLRDPSLSISEACWEILGILKGTNMAVSLTVPGGQPALSVLQELKTAGIKNLLLEVSSLSEACSLFSDRTRFEAAGLLPGICFDVRKENFREIPDIVTFCLNSGIHTLVFPIQRLSAGGHVFCMEHEEISRQLRKLDYGSLRITIHDPFLWQIFFPDAPYHEGGCQAANSMFYISRDFRVYPCPAMPLELGDLHDTSLKEIILSESRTKLRQTLLNPAKECAHCGLAVTCLGGCRGRALAAKASFDAMDPACPR